MALGYTKVNFGELEAAKKHLETTRDSLNEQLKKIKGIIDGSVNNPQIYCSKDARVTKDKFEEMYTKWAQKFNDYVQEYINFFSDAKKTYENRAETEVKVIQKLNSFID